MTGAVFAFLYKVGFEPTAYSLTGNCTTIVLLNLLRCAAPVAEYAFGILNTTHHVPFVLQTNQTYFAICVIGIRILLRSRPIH